MNSSTSLVGASSDATLPSVARRINHDVELAAVIGREADGVPRDQALDYVSGYAIGLDMAIRDTEDRSWRKSFNGATVLGPDWYVEGVGRCILAM